MNRQRSLGHIRAVVSARDAERERELTRTVAKIVVLMRGRPAFAHCGQSGQRLNCSNEDASRATYFLSDDVEAFVHPVNEIHVCVTRWTEDHFGARRNPAPGMRRPIFDAKIRLSFDDSRRRVSMD